MFRFGDPGGRIYGALGTSNANMLAHWSTVNTSSGTLSLQSGGGRTTGTSIKFVGSGGSSQFYLLKTLDSQATWGAAFAFKVSSFTAIVLCQFWDSGTLQVDLLLNADGSLSVRRNGTVLGTTATNVVAAVNVWNHVEFKVTINNSTGTAAVYVNGVSKLSLTGQNTRNSSNNSANQFYLCSTTFFSPITVEYDDIIVYDGQTTDANAFADIVGPIGDCGLAWLLPSGAGTTTQFTPSTGSNYAAVDDSTPNSDTDYVEDSTVGHIDTYAMGDLPAGATGVVALATILYARKTDVGSRGVQTELRSNGGNTAHASEISLADSYQYYFQNWGRDPNNGSATAWTVAAVNALEMGQKVSS